MSNRSYIQLSQQKTNPSLPNLDDKEFCRSLVDEIVEKILDDQFEKYHEEEVIPWTVNHIGELLKEVLDFAFVDTDEGFDLEIESFFPDEVLEDPQNHIEHSTGPTEDVDALSELLEHRFVDVSWQEDSDEEVPVPPMDSWGTASIPVTQIIKIYCECEQQEEVAAKVEAGFDEEVKKISGKSIDRVRSSDLSAKRKARTHPKKPETKLKTEVSLPPSVPAVATAAAGKADVVGNDETQTNRTLTYIPHPLQRHPYPWVGLSSRTKKKVRYGNRRSPVRGARPLATRGEGRGLGKQAACTCQKLCPPEIFQHLPHTTQSDLRAHYLRDAKKSSDAPEVAPQCEACFGKPEVDNDKIEIGAGAVYLDKEKLTPEKMAPRFVQCGVKIPTRRKGIGMSHLDKKKAVALPLRSSVAKKASPRLPLDGNIVDDPKDPLHKSRLIPNISLNCGVSVRAGNEELKGPPFPLLNAAVKKENKEFFATFNIDHANNLERVQSQIYNKFLTKTGTPKFRMSLPKLTPDLSHVS